MKQIIFALLCGAALTAGSFAAKAESLTEYGGGGGQMIPLMSISQMPVILPGGFYL